MNSNRIFLNLFIIILSVCIISGIEICKSIHGADLNDLKSYEGFIYVASILLTILTGIIGVAGDTYNRSTANLNFLYRITECGWVTLCLLVITVTTSICSENLKSRLTDFEKGNNNNMITQLNTEVNEQTNSNKENFQELKNSLAKQLTRKQIDSVVEEFGKKVFNNDKTLSNKIEGFRSKIDSNLVISDSLLQFISSSVIKSKIEIDSNSQKLKNIALVDSIRFGNIQQDYKTVNEELRKFTSIDSIRKIWDSIAISKIEGSDSLIKQIIQIKDDMAILLEKHIDLKKDTSSADSTSQY